MSAFDTARTAVRRAGLDWNESGAKPLKGRGRTALMTCPRPEHPDRNPSCSVTEKRRGGELLVHCHACGREHQDAVWKAFQRLLEGAESPAAPTNGASRRLGAEYVYTDADGRERYRKLRYEPKGFQWSRRLLEEDRVLYRLPEARAAADRGDVIYLTEGEKDADRIVDEGEVATTAGGANDWRDRFADDLIGAGEVVVIADRDEPGRELAERVREACEERAIPVRVVEALTGKDVSDHLDAGGGLATLRDVPPTDLGFVSAADVEAEPTTWAFEGWLPLGSLAVQSGDGGVGKGVFLAGLVARITRGELPGSFHGRPADVLVIAQEDGYGDVWRPRLEVAGADLARVKLATLDRLPPDWNLRDGAAPLRRMIARSEAKVVLIDAVLEHLPEAKGGENLNSPTFVRQALAPLRRITRELSVASVISLHPPKARGARFADMVQGSQAWTALSRIGWIVALHPDDSELAEPDQRRVVIRGKSNLGAQPPSIAFRIAAQDYTFSDDTVQPQPVVADWQECDVGIGDLVKAQKQRSGRQSDNGFEGAITEALLGRGERHSREVKEELRELTGLSERRITELASEHGVRMRKAKGAHGKWEWSLGAPTPDYLRAGPPVAAESPADPPVAAESPADLPVAVESPLPRLLAVAASFRPGRDVNGWRTAKEWLYALRTVVGKADRPLLPQSADQLDSELMQLAASGAVERRDHGSGERRGSAVYRLVPS